MPRIDPLSLLKCLSVLLGPAGGIKSKEEVLRLANLMTKFSKKLVSKCIYIQILKTTNTDLLSQFMSAGGWNLIHTWLTDGILAKNWALIQEILELLLLCPVDIERLKSNNCPKLVKGLSKEGSHQGVRTLATRLVEQWLKIVKGEAAPNSVPAQIMTVQLNSAAKQASVVPSSQQQLQQHYSTNSQQTVDISENATVHVQDYKVVQQSTLSTSINQIQQDQEKQQQAEKDKTTLERLQSQFVQAQIQHQATQQQLKKQFVVVSSQSSVPVYKITIRDGNQVLAKVETDAANISGVLNTSGATEVNGSTAGVTLLVQKPEKIEETEQSGSATSSGQDDTVDIGHLNNSVSVSSEVSSKDNQDTEGVKSKDNKDSKDTISDSSKSSDKENRDSHKKDDKKSSNSSDKKSSSHHHSSSSSSKSSSKYSTSSSTHRSSSTSHKSSHRSSSSSSSSKSSNSSKDRSSKDKDKHHSSSSSKHSSSRSKSDREREKEKQKKDQAEKDKATLEKVQGQALSPKLGKIPKKRTEDEKSDANGRKSSTESRDGSKENKDKADSKKDAVAAKVVVTVTEKKNISISIENRKGSQDSATRPKTVKTFNSKFRSTGLEEEVKPPPPRSKKPNSTVDKKILPPKFPLKRPSPLREAVPLLEKRAKLSLDSPTTPPSEEKKGGIKLIPPKPKPMVLQESDMFMDALTASTKSKEPRKRKRRTSVTKDGSSEAKKQEIVNNADNRESTPPPGSPSNADEKPPVALKPNFKFYQDTLEIEDDKEQKEKENSEEDSKKDKDQLLDDEKDNRDDDDGSNTPTPEDDVEDTKDSESPEEVSSDSSKKDVGYPEIRYVDGLRSVLLLQKRKGPKKVLKWKTDLESIRYFELDETERVNVTKTFTDMKQMEKQNEREAFQMARKLNNEDLMEERTKWKPLIPIKLPPPLVEPGKDSKEKDIQYAREKGILQALYFNRSMIPDSAAEPDEERHHIMTDPKIIPLDDLTGNKESEKDFTSVLWPEPKPQLTPQPTTVTTFHYPTTFPQQTIMTPMGPQSTMGPMGPQMPQQMMAPTHMAPMTQEMPAGGGGAWRTGDGKVLMPDVSMNPMANMPAGFNQGMEGAPMVPPGMMGPPPIYNQQQEGYGMIMNPEEIGFNNMNPNNFQGPPGPMYAPGPNFPGPRGAPMHNRGRGAPGWGYRGGGPGRGGWRGGGSGWRGSGKQPPVCRQFSKNGYCRVGDKCQYLHPGVNCPPF